MSESQFRICDPVNSGIRCTSSNPEPLCKDPDANPSTRVSFDPDNCASITGTNVQDAIDQLCSSQNQAICAAGTTGLIALAAAEVLPINLRVESTLGTAITIPGTTGSVISIGETGSYFVSSTLNFFGVSVAPTDGVLRFNLGQGNTGATGFINDTCALGFSSVLLNAEGGSISTSALICVSGVTGPNRDNELRLTATSTSGLVLPSFRLNTNTTIRKLSSTLCAPP